MRTLTPEEQEFAKNEAKQIWKIFIDEDSERQINVAAKIRESMHQTVFGDLPISTNVFAPAEEQLYPLLEDSYNRYKKTFMGNGIERLFSRL